MNHHKCMLNILVLAAMLQFSACAGLTVAQTQATLKFASAATELGSASSSELAKMHDDTITMNIAMYRLPDLPAADNPVNPKTQKREPIVVTEIRNGEYNNLGSRFAGNWYEVFSSGPQALSAYGQALTAIINADNSAKVKQSTDSLAAALKAIPKSPISNATQSAVSSLSAELTEWALANMKAHAIRTIVRTYDTDVAIVCGLIGDNFTIAAVGQHQPDNFAADFQAVAQTLAASSKTAMDLHSEDRQIRSDSLASWLTAQQNLSEAKTVFPTIIKASGGCTSANAALVRVLSEDRFGLKDIEIFYTDAKQVQSSVRTLSPK
jgi:hypothetical protein